MMRRCALFVALVLAVTCGGDDSGTLTAPSNATTIIAKANYTFTPPWTSVPVGSTMTFQFEGVAHTITFSAIIGAPTNVASTANGSATRTFTSKGVFNYTCSNHSFMTGRITVQ